MAKQSKQPRTSRHGTGANSAGLLQRQLVNEYNAKSGAPAAPAGSKRQGTHTHLPARSLERAAAFNAVPDLTKPASSLEPFALDWDNDADFDWLPPLVECDIEQSERALLAMMADEPVEETAGVDAAKPGPQQAPLDRGVDDLAESDPFLGFLDDGISPADEQVLLAMVAADVPFANAASPLTQQGLMGSRMDTDSEADDFLYNLERPFTDEQERVLQTLMAEDLLNKADEVDAGRPGPQQAPTAAHRKLPAKATVQAEKLASQLRDLGYSESQVNAIQPESRPKVVKYHEALEGFGFTSDEIGSLRERLSSLQVLAEKYPQLRQSLPSLTRGEIVDIAQEPKGDWTLVVLVGIAKELKERPPHLNDQQLALIAKNGKRSALWAVHSLGQELSGHPYNLKSEELVSIASNHGGGLALEAIKVHLPELVKAGLIRQEVVAIASKQGGGRTLEAIVAYLPKLLGRPHHLSRDQVVEFADHHYGYRNLEKIIRSEMIKPHQSQTETRPNFQGTTTNSSSAVPPQALPGQYPPFSYGPGQFGPPHHLPPNRVTTFPFHQYGHQHLERIVRPEMVKPYWAQRDPRFNFQEISTHSTSAVSHQALPRKYQQLRTILPSLPPSWIMDIEKEPAGESILEALLGVAKDLKQKPTYLNDQQVALIAKMGKRQALLAVHSLGQRLSGYPYFLKPEQLVSIGCSRNCETTLKTIMEHLPILVAEPYYLAQEAVVSIAQSWGGAPMLEAIIEYLPDLIGEPFGLTCQEVVAIATHRGSPRELEAVKVHLPKLVKAPYSLAREKVVALACKEDGELALEAVEVHLPKLVKAPYYLAREEVLAMASHSAGRQALQAINDYLPELVSTPDGLTCRQVVAIATSSGGAQALEATKLYLGELLKPLYGLISDQVVAIATAGNGKGKQSLEAVMAYLPKLLAAPYELSRDEVVQIASLQRGKQKLEEIIRSKEVPSQ